MPPSKMRDMPEERRLNMEALDEKVPFPDLIAKCVSMADSDDKKEKLSKYLASYQAGKLRASECHAYPRHRPLAADKVLPAQLTHSRASLLTFAAPLLLPSQRLATCSARTRWALTR